MELVNVSGSIWQKHGPRLPVGALSAPGFSRSPCDHVLPYGPLVGVTNLPFGDVEANQAAELVRVRQEEVLLSASEADVDDDVPLTC